MSVKVIVKRMAMTPIEQPARQLSEHLLARTSQWTPPLSLLKAASYEAAYSSYDSRSLRAPLTANRNLRHLELERRTVPKLGLVSFLPH